jgi:hypothetical protein
MNLIDKIRAETEMWDLFTKKEEYDPLLLDQYERFPYYLSKHRDVMDPILSKYLIDNGLDPKYPDGKKFAVCLTHDIDVIKQTITNCAFESMKSTIKGDYKNSLQYTISGLDKKQHPYRDFERIMEIEDKYGAKSSFYSWHSNLRKEITTMILKKYLTKSGTYLIMDGKWDFMEDMNHIITLK